jgi:DNA-binding transcriptional ArsR family regulator
MRVAFLRFVAGRRSVADAGALLEWGSVRLFGCHLRDVDSLGQMVDRDPMSFDPSLQLAEIALPELAASRLDVGLKRDQIIPSASSLGECVEQYAIVIHGCPLDECLLLHLEQRPLAQPVRRGARRVGFEGKRLEKVYRQINGLDIFHDGNMIPDVPRAATTSDAFNAIAEPRRRDILSYLSVRERPVGDIVTALGVAQPSVSKHLRVLREVGLVDVRRDGRQMLYRTNAAGIRPLHEWTGRFEHYWLNQLNRIKQRAERS